MTMPWWFGWPIEFQMISVLFGILLVILGFTVALERKPTGGNWLPTSNNNAKLQFEQFALAYTLIWIVAFGFVVVSQAYETYDANAYMALCVALATPFLLQPFLFPLPAEKNIPFYMRYSFKANLWIAIFSFIGNYWYTHYFYSVLKAKYTFPAHRLNDVPIALFFATHFYFVTYHTFSNLILRKIESTFVPGRGRTALFWTAVVAFSYFTAFMETFSISSFPYYSFENKFYAYTVGSAFYGIYFLVSFPMFYRLDEKVVSAGEFKTIPHTTHQTIVEALATGMLVLCLLDFCRLYGGIQLIIPGKAYYLYQ